MNDPGIAARGAVLSLAALLVCCGAKVEEAGPVPTLAATTVRAFADPLRAYGSSMVAADVDGDQIPELILGCPAYEAPHFGLVLVLSGVDLSVVAVLMPDPSTFGAAEPWRFGASLAVADFDGDGWPDLAVGAPSMVASDQSQAGQVWVYRGSAGLLFPEVRVAREPRAGGRFGARLVVADLEPDGRPELVVAEPGGEGKVWVLRGNDLELAEEFQPEHGGAEFGAELQALHPSFGGGLIVGAPQDPGEDGDPRGAAYVLGQSRSTRVQPAGEEQDFAASFAQGDFDGDGELELVASAFGGEDGAAALYHFESGIWESPERRGLPGGVEVEPRAGLFSLSDVTGDGHDELLVLGDSESLVLYSPRLDATYARLPYAVSSAVAGDLDGDGVDELLVCSTGDDHPLGVSLIRLVDFGVSDLRDLSEQ